MSFFTSVFGMNVSEFDDGSQVKLGVAMAYASKFLSTGISNYHFIYSDFHRLFLPVLQPEPDTILVPLSLLLILVFVTIAFRRDVRDWTLEALNPNKKLVKNPLRGRKSRLPGSRLPNHPHHHAKADEKATSGSGSSQSTGNSTAGLLGRLRGRGGLLKKRNAKEMV